MIFGRLIRVGAYRRDGKLVAYIVADPDPTKAVDLIKNKVGVEDEIEDLGRVSSGLLQALNLKPGDFVRA
jgi:hypothetical protein